MTLEASAGAEEGLLQHRRNMQKSYRLTETILFYLAAIYVFTKSRIYLWILYTQMRCLCLTIQASELGLSSLKGRSLVLA